MIRQVHRMVGRLMRCLLALLATCAILSAATRYHQYSDQYRNPKQPATPLMVGYLGGTSDEYRIDAAVLNDGAVVLAGNCYGEGFQLA